MASIVLAPRADAGPPDSGHGWINEAMQWGTVQSNTTAVVSAATWFDEGTPWAVFTLEDIQCNVDVADYIQAKDP